MHTLFGGLSCKITKRKWAGCAPGKGSLHLLPAGKWARSFQRTVENACGKHVLPGILGLVFPSHFQQLVEKTRVRGVDILCFSGVFPPYWGSVRPRHGSFPQLPTGAGESYSMGKCFSKVLWKSQQTPNTYRTLAYVPQHSTTICQPHPPVKCRNFSKVSPHPLQRAAKYGTIVYIPLYWGKMFV